MADRDAGAARRRRERRMRSWWHHEQVSIAAAVAAALHHSARPVTYKAPRGQKTATEEVEKTTHNVPRHQKTPLPGGRPGVLKDPAPQGAVTVGYVAAPGPLLSTPSFADSMADSVDDRAVQILLQLALKKKEEDEEERRRAEEEKHGCSTRRLATTCRSLRPSGRHGGSGSSSCPPPRPLLGQRGRGRKGGRRKLPELLPHILLIAVLVVDNDSGMLALLVISFPVVFFFDKVVDVSVVQVVQVSPVLVVEETDGSHCCSSLRTLLVFNIPVVAQRLIPMVLFSRPQRFLSCNPLTRCCSMSSCSCAGFSGAGRGASRVPTLAASRRLPCPR